MYLGAAQNLWVFGKAVLFFHQYPENSLTKRTPGRARSRPKPPSLRRRTRSRTGPGPRRGPATPSSPTWGKGPGAIAAARVRRRRRVTERSAAPAADAACPEVRARSGGAWCVQSHTPARGSESHVVPGMGLRVLDKSREFGTVQVQSVLWRTFLIVTFVFMTFADRTAHVNGS